MWIETQPALRAVVADWDDYQWRPVLAELARKLAWTKPLVPAPGDPAPLAAQPFPCAAPTAPPTRPATPIRKEDNDARLAA